MNDEANKAPAAGVDPQRKTLDERQRMTDLERVRHSCAHVPVPLLR